MTRSISCVVVAAFGCLAGASPALAQEEAAPCGVVARVLQRARESGALERVLGARHFKLAVSKKAGENAGQKAGEKPRGQTCVVRGELLDGDRLRFEYERRWRDKKSVYVERQRVEIGLADGHTYRYSQLSGTVSDPEPFGLEGTLSGRTFTMVQCPDRGGDASSFPWSDDTVARLLVLYVLPALFDQGLPGQWACTDLEGYYQFHVGDRLTLAPGERDKGERQDGGEELHAFVWTQGPATEGTQPARGTVLVNKEGRIVKLASEGAEWVAVGKEEYERLTPGE